LKSAENVSFLKEYHTDVISHLVENIKLYIFETLDMVIKRSSLITWHKPFSFRFPSYR